MITDETIQDARPTLQPGRGRPSLLGPGAAQLSSGRAEGHVGAVFCVRRCVFALGLAGGGHAVGTRRWGVRC